jgi:hypothetical protein
MSEFNNGNEARESHIFVIKSEDVGQDGCFTVKDKSVNGSLKVGDIIGVFRADVPSEHANTHAKVLSLTELGDGKVDIRAAFIPEPVI